MTTYTKPYLNIKQQVALLCSRGMEITDFAKAEGCLERIGYYRLSGYWYPMRATSVVTNPDGSSSLRIEDNFKPDVKFSDVMELYIFDKKLRLLMLDAIERIEVGLRVCIALLLGPRNPDAHLDPNELHGNFTKKVNPKTGKTEHQVWIDRHNLAIRRSHEDFVRHFSIKYPNSNIPIWMAIELWDFGALSYFLAGMKHADRTAIALKFGYPREDMLTSLVRSINSVRNGCAHHTRLWNRPIIDWPSPPKPNEINLLSHISGDTHAQTRLYAIAAGLQYLLRTINPSSAWGERLKEHCKTFPTSTGIDFTQTGFPKDWDKLPLWN